MLKRQEYRNWSSEFHDKHSLEPIVIQLELTYRCPLHCLHCYSDCYNTAKHAQRELSTSKIKKIIDNLFKAGCFWLCFTGGDPLMRNDFLDLYEHARKKGFIVTVFTSLITLNSTVLKKFIEKPPFSIETTLNGATKEVFEKISCVEGSFEKAISNLRKIRGAKLPLKIKTKLSKNNIHELHKLKKLVESFDCEFLPNAEIYPRLDGDLKPCEYRLPLRDYPQSDYKVADGCHKVNRAFAGKKQNTRPNRYFRCGVGNWLWHINPYGELNICTYVREPAYNVFKGDLLEGIYKLSNYVRTKEFETESECRYCKAWEFCQSCPGKARLEMKNEELPIPYFCELAHRIAREEEMYLK